jgi:hypothetical protein
MDYSLLLYFCKRLDGEDESTPHRSSHKTLSLKKNENGDFIYELGADKSSSIVVHPISEQDIRPSESNNNNPNPVNRPSVESNQIFKDLQNRTHEMLPFLH